MAGKNNTLPVMLDDEEYDWVKTESERAGISKGGVVRQAIRLYRATGGLLGPTRMQIAQQASATTESGTEAHRSNDDIPSNNSELHQNE